MDNRQESRQVILQEIQLTIQVASQVTVLVVNQAANLRDIRVEIPLESLFPRVVFLVDNRQVNRVLLVANQLGSRQLDRLDNLVGNRVPFPRINHLESLVVDRQDSLVTTLLVNPVESQLVILRLNPVANHH